MATGVLPVDVTRVVSGTGGIIVRVTAAVVTGTSVPVTFAMAPAVTVTVVAESAYPAFLKITVWDPGATELMVTGVVPFSVPSTNTEAPDGLLPAIRTLPAGVVVTFAASTFTGTWAFVVSAGTATAGLREMACIPVPGSPETGPVDIPATAGAGTIDRSKNNPMRRPVIVFIVSPKNSL